MTLEIEIAQEDQGLVGPHTFVGRLAEHDRFEEFLEAKHQHVHVRFETSSMAQRRQNGGPEAVVVPELAVPGAAQAMLKLANECDEVTAEQTGA